MAVGSNNLVVNPSRASRTQIEAGCLSGVSNGRGDDIGSFHVGKGPGEKLSQASETAPPTHATAGGHVLGPTSNRCAIEGYRQRRDNTLCVDRRLCKP